jgi:Protein of unknown function (DUF2637)
MTIWARNAEARERRPGRVPIGIAASLLTVIALGLFEVSVAAQYQYLLPARHGERIPAATLAGALDALMITFSLLAYGMSRAGKPAPVERALIMGCAVASAGMNLAEANVASPRSVAAYVAAPVALAVTIDRLVAVVYRFYTGRPQRSAWAGLRRVALYVLRFCMDPLPTVKGVRQMTLAAAPVPGQQPAAAAPRRPRRDAVPAPRPPAELPAPEAPPGEPPAPAEVAGMRAADAIRAAVAALGGEDAGDVVAWLKERGVTVEARRVNETIKRDQRLRSVPDRQEAAG